MNKLSEKKKTELLKEAICLAERAAKLLDECYLAHCKATGIKP